MAPDSVLWEGKAQDHLVSSATGRDWSGVKSRGTCRGWNCRMAAGAGEEFPQLQHCSHRRRLRTQGYQNGTVSTFPETAPIQVLRGSVHRINVPTLRHCRHAYVCRHVQKLCMYRTGISTSTLREKVIRDSLLPQSTGMPAVTNS